MPTLTIISWRDIPAQVNAGTGRRVVKAMLPQRFQVAVDRAAKRASKGEMSAYLAEWRRVERPCGDDPAGEVAAEVARLERAVHAASGSPRAVAAGGVDVGAQTWTRRHDRVAGRSDRHLHPRRPSRPLPRRAPTCSTPRVRSASTSTRSAAGAAICGRCQVAVSAGSFAKRGITSSADHLSPPGALERRYERQRGPATGRGLEPGRRLACAATLVGDVVVDVPAASQVHRQVDPQGRSSAAAVRPRPGRPAALCRGRARVPRGFGIGPRPPARGARGRVGAHGSCAVDAAVVRALQAALRAGDGAVTAAVHDGGRVTAIWPGLRDRVFGVAIDIGSTTIAGHLASLLDGAVVATAGAMNPQIRFGEDLMSRVSYAMLHAGGAAEMTAAVRGALRDLVADLGRARRRRARRDPRGRPGRQPGHAPSRPRPRPDPARPGAVHARHRACGPRARGAARARRPPGGAALRPALHRRPRRRRHRRRHPRRAAAGLRRASPSLVDVGTNAELVLGDRHRLVAASSPTGPAFEGAQISAGQRAAPGAIERVRVDPATLEPRFRVIGCPLWSDDPGFAAATAATGVTGICGSGIIEALAELFLAGVIRPDGAIDGAFADGRRGWLRTAGRSRTSSTTAPRGC